MTKFAALIDKDEYLKRIFRGMFKVIEFQSSGNNETILKSNKINSSAKKLKLIKI